MKSAMRYNIIGGTTTLNCSYLNDLCFRETSDVDFSISEVEDLP